MPKIKIKDLVAFLLTLDQEADLYEADYYYECREGFSPSVGHFKDYFKAPKETHDLRNYPDNCILFDQQGGL